MKLLRRQFLHLAAGAGALPALSRFARAQAYPSRPVRIIVGFGAGGTPDINARLIAQWLSERLGQQFIIENRPGAGGNIAAEAAMRAPADGHTLLWVNAANAVSATLYDKLNFNLIRDIAPVAGVTGGPQVMEVIPSFPAKTVPEFIAYAKANPGKINMASSGTGNLSHVSGELFKMMTGVEMLHVPYRGAGPALNDLLSGEMQVMFDAMPSSIAHIRAGKLHPLAVTTAMRWEGLPDIPTVGDFVAGYETSVWSGIGTPRNTPTEFVDRLNKEINAGLADSKIKARLLDLGGMVLAGSPADFGKLIADETEKWGKVVKFAGIKPE
ncbi:MAG TPA: tripartite tricarboxylate transporter substrate binding protein [Xanthobacteraceae bacterium]|nr:tripartite tricarboxylate transporter substrate binding protein [Xanthobacteraceae bacterium]